MLETFQPVINFFDFVQGLGVSVMMAIVISLLGMAFGTGVGKSIRAGLTVGVGFTGLNLVINELLGTNLGPAAQEMIARYGLELQAIDIGWPATAAIAFGSTVGIIIIPVGLLVNVLMLLTNTTQTVNVDIWDYWHFAFTGALAAIVTGNVVIGVIVAALNMVIIMVLADYTAPYVEESLDLPGVSLPHGFSTAYAPIALVLNKIIDMIPIVRDINFDVKKAQEKFGVFGEPILVGGVLGLIIGTLAGYSIQNILTLAVSLSAVLVLIPKMASLLMEGLVPISDAASDWIQKNFENRGKIYIGLDSAVGVGHPITMAVALILVPVSIFLAVLLPGNIVMPFGDLGTLPWMFVLITPIVRNNGFRALVIGFLSLVTGLYMASDLAPLMTTAANNVNFNMPEGATLVSSIVDGANPMTWGMVRTSEFGWIGVAILAIISLGLAVWNRNRIIKETEELNHKDENSQVASQ